LLMDIVSVVRIKGHADKFDLCHDK
jgi:hypothetical protein